MPLKILLSCFMVVRLALIRPLNSERKSVMSFKRRTTFYFFDGWHVAYQGFASGSLDEDAAASVRSFASRGMELLVAQSYSKNLGLYAEMTGAMNFVCSATRVKSQLKSLARPMYSNPPIRAKIVANVVGDPALFNEWKAEMEMMAGPGRIKN